MSSNQLHTYIDGYQQSAVIYVAAKLRLADLIAEGLTDSTSLANHLEVAQTPLLRLLRALASLGFCRETSSDAFELDEIGHLLRENHPDSQRHKALLAVEQYWPSWMNLLYSVQTGETAFEFVHGMSPWTYREQNPELGECFNLSLQRETDKSTESIIAALDLKAVSTIADIGGGTGALFIKILTAYPYLTGTLFDQGHVVAATQKRLERAGLTPRGTTLGGDLFTAIPVTADLYILKSVLHDWDDTQCNTILRNCRAAMHRDSKLVLIERLLPEKGGDEKVSLLDIRMLLITGGKERSLKEYQRLTHEAGLLLQQTVATESGVVLMECIQA